MDMLYRHSRRTTRNSTKRLSIAAAITVLGVGGAQAAGAPPVAYYNWSGFYVGATVGDAVGRNRTNEREWNLPNSVFNDENFHLSPSGLSGGIQGGLNWQMANWVAGIEGDLQWTGQSDKSFCGNGCNFYEGTRIDQKLPWFATARGRFGYAVDTVLFYGTAGVAVAKVETTVSPYDAPPVKYFPFGTTATKSGWTAGAGIEAAVGGRWTAKIEYLYFDIGKIAAGGHTGGTDSFGQISSSIRDHIFRVGLNYRLGAQPQNDIAPATVAGAQPQHDWRGFYVGGNAGYGVARNNSSAKFIDFSGDPLEAFVVSPAGGLFGAQAGYNWQHERWVFGVESDLQYSGQKGEGCLDNCVGGHLLTVDQAIRWLGTTRGRAGYATASSLFYLTAGLAYGRVDTNGAFQVERGTPPVPYSGSTTKAGWVLGGGIETSIATNWSIKAEYLYVDLGRAGPVTATAVDNEGYTAFIPIDSRIHDHIIRAGLNYSFAGGGRL
jgi:outer membrane immunogenic protein